MIDKSDYVPLRENAYELIKRMILKGYFKPGERLIENQLSKKFGVSRTPIRESIRKLAAEGLVEITPKGGTKVSKLTKKDIDEIYEIRGVLESLAAEKAASLMSHEEIESLEKLLKDSEKTLLNKDMKRMAQIDTKIHNLICKYSKNNRLSQLIDVLCTNITRQRELILETPGAGKEAIAGHRKIINAIKKRDKQVIKKSVHEHIMRGREILLEKILSNNIDGS
jgi:DNA-binding GntR family transcriptional regulator